METGREREREREEKKKIMELSFFKSPAAAAFSSSSSTLQKHPFDTALNSYCHKSGVILPFLLLLPLLSFPQVLLLTHLIAAKSPDNSLCLCLVSYASSFWVSLKKWSTMHGVP
jgi:hypothetical protein